MSQAPQWQVAKASVPGRGHLDRDIPCQDAFQVERGANYVILAVGDGAGSQSHSQHGSREACDVAVKALSKELMANKWHHGFSIPDLASWKRVRQNVITQVLEALHKRATKEGVEVKNLATTLIATIVTESCIMGFHVGDGRGCYQNAEGDWVALFVPFKGEFANETVFLTSAPFVGGDSEQYVDDFIIPTGGKQPVVLMTDGCEMHSFECHIVNHETGHYSDPNRPYPGFFNPIIATLQNLSRQKTAQELDTIWQQFLTDGTEGLKNEADDKTMVIAYWQ